MKTSNKGAGKTAAGKQTTEQVSELTTNRLSVYLRCLSTLEDAGEGHKGPRTDATRTGSDNRSSSEGSTSSKNVAAALPPVLP